MDFFKAILISALKEGELEVTSPWSDETFVRVCEGKCYQMLSDIRDIIADDSVDDPECFLRIESIVSLFEREGISAGNRHDFG